METFAKVKELVNNYLYQEQRRRTLQKLSEDMIDEPIIHLVNGFNRLPFCFTLQSCYGHFIYDRQKDMHNIDPLPVRNSVREVEYRIAYMAFCIENSLLGRELIRAFKEIPTIDPEYIQFCCAEWFWKRQVNSYALQVEPDRFKDKDTAVVDFKEALYLEKRRSEFFNRLDKLLKSAKEW